MSQSDEDAQFKAEHELRRTKIKMQLLRIIQDDIRNYLAIEPELDAEDPEQMDDLTVDAVDLLFKITAEIALQKTHRKQNLTDIVENVFRATRNAEE